MVYKFRVKKSQNVSDDDFESAFHCAIKSIQSILDDHDCKIQVKIPEVYIEFSELQAPAVTLQSCSELIKEAFIDSNRRMYPEFFGVDKEEVDYI